MKLWDWILHGLLKREDFIDTMDSETIIWSYWTSQNIAFSDNIQGKEQIHSLFVSDPEGNYTGTDGEGSFADTAFFQRVINTKEFVISAPFKYEESRELVYAIIRPVIVKDKIRIVLGGIFKCDFFQSYIESMKINNVGNGLIIDGNSNIIVHSDKNLTGENLHTITDSNSFLEAIDNMKLGVKGKYYI